MSSRLRSSQSILLFYESHIKSVPQIRLFSAVIPSYVICKLETVFVNFYIENGYVIVLMLVTIFVRFYYAYYAGTVCARRRARLLVMFRSDCGLEIDCQVTLN